MNVVIIIVIVILETLRDPLPPALPQLLLRRPSLEPGLEPGVFKVAKISSSPSSLRSCESSSSWMKGTATESEGMLRIEMRMQENFSIFRFFDEIHRLIIHRIISTKIKTNDVESILIAAMRYHN